MALYDNPGDAATSRWTPEQRAQKQEEMARQSASLRDARLSQRAGQPALTSLGGPIASAQLQAGPATPPPAAQPTPAVAPQTLNDVNALPPTQAGPRQAPSLNQYRPTGIGANAQGGQIVTRTGAGGVPEFTNDPIAQKQSLESISPMMASNGSNQGGGAGGGSEEGEGPSPNASLASLGSAGNLGNGRGTFSQASPGDAAYAMDQYAKARQVREEGANRTRLEQANGRKASLDNLTIVADSSRQLDRGELIQQRRSDELGQLARQSRLEDVAMAQGQIGNTQQLRAGEQSLKQASRLEEVQIRATAPNATDEDRAALRLAIDPSGNNEASRQKAIAETGRADAQARKFDAEAAKSGRGARALPATLQKLEDADIESMGLVDNINGELGRFDKMIEEGSLQLGPFANLTSAARNSTGLSDPVSQNYASFQATLEKVRNDSLRLNKGVQTDGDAQRAWNELLTNINDPQVVRQRLSEIQRLNEQASALKGGIINNRRQNQGLEPLDIDTVLDRQRQVTEQQRGGEQPQAVGPVRIATPEDIAKLPAGATFLGPDGIVRSKP